MDVLRVGVVGYTDPKFDIDQARVLIGRAFDTIASQYPHHQVTVVSGLTNLGIPKIAYEEVVKRGWRTAGVACNKATEFDCFPVERSRSWGETGVMRA